jgi:acetoin utilization protein AcuB
MRRHAPLVSEFMTRMPHELDRTASVAEARQLMLRHDIGHLPVMAGGHLHGIVSERDLRLFRPRDETPLGDMCERDVVTVAPTATVVDAARSMLRRGVGCVVVMDGGAVVGIFSAKDALSALVAAYE